MQPVVIFGASGFGREVAWLAEQMAGAGDAPVACVADDDPRRIGTTLNGYHVVDLETAKREYPDAPLVVAIGNPVLRRQIVERASTIGWPFVSLIHPRVERSRWIEFDEGVVVCAGCILTTNIRIGKHVHLNLDCTIGHDVDMEDFVTLAPGVHVSGNVRIESGAYVGTGATIINGREGEPLIVGAGAVIGAGACVTRNIAPGVTAVGVPAKARGA